MVWARKVFCREQLGAAVISSSALVTAGVTGKKLVTLEAFILLVRFHSSSKQHAPESMISEITSSGESELNAQVRLGGGVKKPCAGSSALLQSAPKQPKSWTNVLETRIKPNTNTQQAKKPPTYGLPMWL